ncbi:hypothetical protein HT031_004136 [Scenedesmus sp. PABB004]|nr:hypothetical protein HT031_004136 [Scenedesmus sp. PABB004]
MPRGSSSPRGGAALALALAGCLLAPAAAAFTCGAPGAPCGASIPAGASCGAKGAGYCAPGHFCGWVFSDSDRSTRCMPVPKGAGRAGASCLPGNALKPVASAAAATPKPVCADGSTCFFTPTPDASGWSAPPFASPAGPLLGTCRRVPAGCGAAPGAPCCPSLYHVASNPALPSPSICAGDAFCDYLRPGEPGFNPDWPAGTCTANRPGCGAIGASCCISTGGVSVDARCGAGWGQPGPKGYCAYPGGKATRDMRDQACRACPAASVVAANPSAYWGCPGQ